MNAWEVEKDPKTLRRLGKLSEELGECSAIASRAIIQGIDGLDPGTGRTNRQRLLEELADVQAQIECTMSHLDLDLHFLQRRVALKVGQMAEWEDLLVAKL